MIDGVVSDEYDAHACNPNSSRLSGLWLGGSPVPERVSGTSNFRIIDMAVERKSFLVPHLLIRSLEFQVHRTFA